MNNRDKKIIENAKKIQTESMMYYNYYNLKIGKLTFNKEELNNMLKYFITIEEYLYCKDINDKIKEVD